MKSIPLRPSTAERQVEGASFPTGETAPRPVTTTLRTGRSLVGLAPAAAADDQVDVRAVLQVLARCRALRDHPSCLDLLRPGLRDLPDLAVRLRDCPAGRGKRL